MEVQSNLTKDHRLATLAKFKTPLLRSVAEIAVGDPPAAFTKLAQEKRLQLKQEEADKEFKLKKAEERRLWQVRKMQKQTERKRKKEEKERLRKIEEMKRMQEK